MIVDILTDEVKENVPVTLFVYVFCSIMAFTVTLINI